MIFLHILGALVLLFLLYMLFLFVCSLFVDPKQEYDTNSPFYRFLLYSATGGALKLLRIRIHTSGLEQIPTDRRVLFVCNHRSNFDPIITWHALREQQIAFISKERNFRIPFFGRFIRKCCFLSIDRQDPRKAIVTINRAAELLRRQEVSIGVYPEGTRSKSGELLPFHNGVFKIAQKADAPIVVLSVMGTEKIHRQISFRASLVHLDVLEMIPPEQIKGKKTEIIGKHVRALLLDHEK